MVSFTIALFLVCARGGVGATSADDSRIFTCGYGVIFVFTAYNSEAIRITGRFSLLTVFNIKIPLALLAYPSTVEIDWVLSRREGRLEGPYFLYSFGDGMPDDLPDFTRRKRRRSAMEGEPDVFIRFPAVQPQLLASYGVDFFGCLLGIV